jgi:outer membrane protein TolC
VDVLNAQASRSTARQNFIANKYALAVSRYSFSLALGRLPFDFYTATHENKN